MIKEYNISFLLKQLCNIIKRTGAFKQSIVERSKSEESSFKHKKFNQTIIGTLDVYAIKSNTNDVFIYLHGGGYLLGIDDINSGFINDLQKKTNSSVYMIDYPLAPLKKVEYVLEEVFKTVNEIISINQDKSIHLIGDSAGGGMCLPILKRLNDQLIDHVFLLSPWLDVSMSNQEIDNIKHLDVILKKEDLIECGKLYSNNNPTMKDASPIFDDFKGYDQITIFIGTYDMLYPDVMKFYELNPKTDLHIYHKAPHDFMIFPFTKEKKQVINTIKDIIKR